MSRTELQQYLTEQVSTARRDYDALRPACIFEAFLVQWITDNAIDYRAAYNARHQEASAS